jgi:hypothetical protein
VPGHLSSADERTERLLRIVDAFRGRKLAEAVAVRGVWHALVDEAEADDPDKLVLHDLLLVARHARFARLRQPAPELYHGDEDVILVPGLAGCELTDLTGESGTLWIDSDLYTDATSLYRLKLAPFQLESAERDATRGVTVRATGPLPLLYEGLRHDLESNGYAVQVFAYDWRKDLEASAVLLADVLRERLNQRFRAMHLVAHSQGALVARRALQMVGAPVARELVNHLVLLAPITRGTFAAALALAGRPEALEAVRRFAVPAPPGFGKVLRSMIGLYQLLPWRFDPVSFSSQTASPPPGDKATEWVRANGELLRSASFWKGGIDAGRLARTRELLDWAGALDSSFLNDRTTIILGNYPTVGGVKWQGDRLEPDADFTCAGDGTVPDAFALLAGVSRVYRCLRGEHLTLPTRVDVITAVRDLLAGRPLRVVSPPGGRGLPEIDGGYVRIPYLDETVRGDPLPGPEAAEPARRLWRELSAAERFEPEANVPAPETRRLRVLSYAPVTRAELQFDGPSQIVLELPWEFADGNRLRPGPVGEYLEVVDVDPVSRCCYPPVDLNHPFLLARDGLPAAEGDPRFHQQMVYAVAMDTIRHFERALGWVVLWAPHLRRDPDTDEVVASRAFDDEYVERLRIYPHGLRGPSAYYSPEKKALLFGYAPSQGIGARQGASQGIVFTCLSFELVAHETVHAILDGLRPNLMEWSNPDVWPFLEGFAEAVSLFQLLSHTEVVAPCIAATRDDGHTGSRLAILAAQLGEAMPLPMRGALRGLLAQRDDTGRWTAVAPDPMAISRVFELYERGAILVAALVRALTSLYQDRVRDLLRIASGGAGALPDGDLHPDLVWRMASEASTAARHLLTLCVRALDYLPPVDVTLSEFLRALVTADADLVRDDARRYRTAVVEAFRDWGIYPGGVRSMSVDSLPWSPPAVDAVPRVKHFFDSIDFGGWSPRTERRSAFQEMRSNCVRFHRWLRENTVPGRTHSLGLYQGGEAFQSIRRDPKDRPVFEVHSFRPCRRVGPDGQ